MEKIQGAARKHVLILPLPLQGHINPMLQFSKRLASKGLKVTLLTFTGKPTTQGEDGLLSFESISNTSEESRMDMDADDYMKKLQDMVALKLPAIVAKHEESGFPVSCLIYDSFMPWALELARKIGISPAPFFTESCAVCAIYYALHEGKLKIPTDDEASVSLQGLPPLEAYDLPSFFYDLEKYQDVLSYLASQFLNIEEVDWIFCNTFDILEQEMVNWMANKWPIKSIGPTIPSMFLDKRLEDDKEYGLSLFKPNSDACMKWLDAKEPYSVVYVSFGSLAALGEAQMTELAWGLKRSNTCFLWVVREPEKEKLPNNFIEETKEMGLVVTWSPQLEVLAHKSVGCFVTHCGWNSILEALSFGVPMVAMPQWTDQPTNAKFVSDVWKVGIRVKVDEEGIATKEEIERCMREVMEGETRNEMKKNLEKWKKLACLAVDEGGSSDKNIEEFTTKLTCSSNGFKE
ncbi:UDP-glycosyltransferase 74E2 [Manihot esculenta]|uniref:Glycosyltransferase n=1 Tax=Manihot esculenta TaxID=3983 RepID=A0A2C9VVI3_MANES|nr:UDP-glycosyltransferase 74E2 [Manihot esculenta]